MANILEEKLREAACLGDLYALRTLISRNVNINSQNSVNGWTALHWAVKRNHADAVKMLLEYGANPNLTNEKGETPSSLCTKPNISELLGSTVVVNSETKMDFIPSYIAYPNLCVDLTDVEPINNTKPNSAILPVKEITQTEPTIYKNNTKNDLVIRARIKNSDDNDYIEFDMCKRTATFDSLVKKCCEELEIVPDQLVKIKKGDVRLRNDADVRRFSNLVYLDVFVKES